MLKDLVQELENPDEKKEDNNVKSEEATTMLSFDATKSSELVKKKERKDRFQTPEYIFILDDLSDEMGSASVTALLKKNRHFRCKVILSSQYPNDLSKSARKQIDIWILFKSLSKKT